VQEIAVTPLQWSRANDGAETKDGIDGIVGRFTLQWSRANDGAETGICGFEW